MRILKLKIYQPEAHYRIPYSYQRRFTYPIPPLSTIKGFLCNVLGIESDQEETFKRLRSGLSIGVFGKYKTLIKEYVWFRSLSKDAHNNRFSISTNRIIDNEPQHPGGQMPVKVDTLLDVNLNIYIFHSDYEILQFIKESLENPSNRNSHLHLGRAEDWLLIEDIKFLERKDLRVAKVVKLDFFSWIPSYNFVCKEFVLPEYERFYKDLQGIQMKMPTYYEIIDGQRVFTKFVEVKLFEGGVFRPIEAYVDEEDVPIILAYLEEV